MHPTNNSATCSNTWQSPCAASASLKEWSFADDYVYRLVQDMYLFMKNLLGDIEGGAFNLDVSLRQGVDAQVPHYMAIQTDSTK